MQIAVITNKTFENIFLNLDKSYNITYLTDINLLQTNYDLIFDFLYEANVERNELLKAASQNIFINYVNGILTSATKTFIRFNGWNSLCENLPIEISYFANENNSLAILNTIGISYIIVPNTIGMITAKVVSMIVNEAYFALGENVSTKAEIDIAMQLGTNYPYGPFAWSEKIGLKNIYFLLLALGKDNDRYKVSAFLQNEIN